MTREQLWDSFERWVFPAFTFYGKPDEQKKEKLDYANTIYGLCGQISGLHFDEAAKHLMRNWKASQKPKAGHFYGAYRYLGDMKGWGQAEAKKCGQCNATGFVYVWVNDGTGREYKAMIGCSSCNERLSGLKRGLVLTEPHPEPKIKDIKIRPEHAKILWRIAEDAGFNLNEELAERLLYWAGQTDKCLEVIEREMQSGRSSGEVQRERVATEEYLKAHYANVPTPGYVPPRPAPAVAVAPPPEPPTPPPEAAPAPPARKSTPTQISADDAAAMDMPF